MPLDSSRQAQSVGNYDLLEKIAEGGMGTVYRGRHRETGQIVAIKILAQNMTNNQVLLKRFEKEYNAARQLNHPNIVRALDYGTTTAGTPFLALEFVEGESLGQKISREGALPEKEAIRLIAQVAQGLYKAHKEKLIHRDVKPDNILVTNDGIAKLADLGLVKEIEADLNLTRTGRGLGTPHFMAPEQFKNAKNADPRCDIYSLGATLYMMVTGEMPFRSHGPLDAYMKKIENNLTPPREINAAISDRIDWAIRRAMSADPEQRPMTCREFVEDLAGRSVQKKPAADEPSGVHQDAWYLYYDDDEGVTHTLKGTTAGIRRSLREGLLGDASNVRASRTKDGNFQPLRSFPEFRDLVIQPGTTPTPAPPPPAAKSPLPPPPPPPSPPPVRVRPQRQVPVAASGSSDSHAVGNFKAPHISIQELKTHRSAPPRWLQWVLLLLLVGIGAVVGIFIFGR